MDLVDIGVNLTSERFDNDRDAVLDRAVQAGVRRMLLTGTSVTASHNASELAARHPACFWSTAGIHPHAASDCDDAAVAELGALARDNPRVVAIGETGLDFNRDFSPRADQESAFVRQLELAAALKLPVFIHERDAHERLSAILREHAASLPDAVVHCFTGSRAALDDYLDLGLHIGVTGWICDERRGQALREQIPSIPAERLMLETDAPWLVPRDLRPKPRGGRNEPAFLPHVAEAVAHCRGQETGELARETTATAERFFGLPATEPNGP